MSKIYKTPLLYRILRMHSNNVYQKWFTSVEINGEERIPEDASVIFAPNHQNAFTDAMALLSSSPKPVVFLARADLFNKKLANKILRWLKIMPAYRMRNGISNLKKNADSFEQAAQVLEHKEFFCLMPEGGQEEMRKLRPLVKGMFRIGFAVQDHYKDTNETVYIIPTGIDYASYDHSGGHMVINFGKPIKMRDYYDKYVENAPVAYNEIRAELYRRMSTLMLDIRTDDYYDTIYAACYIYNLDMLDEMGWEDNETNRLAARQHIAANLDEIAAMEKYKGDMKELDSMVKEWIKTRPAVEEEAIVREYGNDFDGSFLRALIHAFVFAVPAAVSAIVNAPIFALGKWACEKWTVGTGFYSTVALAVNMVIFPIYHFILMLAVGIPLCHYDGGNFPGWAYALVFCILLPWSYFFSYRYWWNFKFLWKRVKNLFRKDDLTDRIADKLTDLFSRLKEDRRNGITPQTESPKVAEDDTNEQD